MKAERNEQPVTSTKNLKAENRKKRFFCLQPSITSNRELMKRAIIVITTTFVLFFFLSVTGFCQERSPFEEASKSLYNYEKAVATLSLKGIITTNRFSNAIFLIREVYSVYSPGDEFCVTVEGLKYTLTVKTVEKKSVILQGTDKKNMR